MKSKQKITPQFASNFWYSEPDFDSDVLSSYTPTSDTTRLYKLAAAKRAISNFVRIVVPDKVIKTNFQISGHSYTDGNTVIIGADVDNVSKFDVAVGLALHEAAHIKLSDFGILRDIIESIRSHIGHDGLTELVEKSREAGVAVYEYGVANELKQILNYVEDRRIDQYIYDTAPGYRDYYQALYNKYFNDTVILKGLESSEYTDETYESYMFRLINLHSSGARLNALKALPQIWKVLDLKNISRLKTSMDSLGVAITIYSLIIDALQPTTKQESSEESDESGESNETESDESGESNETESDKSGESNETESDESGESNETESDMNENESPSDDGKSSIDEETDNDSDESDENGGSAGMSGSGTDTGSQTDSDSSDGADSNNVDGDTQREALSASQKAKLDKQIKKQKKFIDGDIDKKKLSKADTQSIQQIEVSGSELVEVGKDGNYKTNCVVIRNVTTETAQNTKVFPFYTNHDRMIERNDEWVRRGIRMGKQLAGKLQVRSDERTTEYNRLNSGKIDRRMLSQLGAGQTNVFFTKEVDRYNKANLHISIDGSSSMSGAPWHKTIMTTVALIKAIEEIPNLNVQVSIRGTTYDYGKTLPLIAIVYNSRVDKFSKVLKLFNKLTPNGLTPEGLAFEAITKEIVDGGANLDSYFLNISDGQPYLPSIRYDGYAAINHTKKQVQSIQNRGIKVLSYFITDSSQSDYIYTDYFCKMYGSSARKINVENIAQIAKTMNDMFLAK
jgi:hypothetical protein